MRFMLHVYTTLTVVSRPTHRDTDLPDNTSLLPSDTLSFISLPPFPSPSAALCFPLLAAVVGSVLDKAPHPASC